MKRILYYLLLAFTSLGILALLGGFGIYIWASKDLPSVTRIQDYRPPQVTTVYASDGSVMGTFFREKRYLINLDQMPHHLPMAFLAAEDSSFFVHSGVDFKAILRAVIANTRTQETRQGGSTITQQIVKRLLLTPEKTYSRKVREAILSFQLERYLDKQQLLYIYLNQIYLGTSAYGVEAAARTYFGKYAHELSIAESAMLASLPKAPSRNPYREPEYSKQRKEWVLGRMLEEGFISADEYATAMAEKLEYKSMPDPSWEAGAWYLEEVRRQLITFFTEQNVRALNLPLEQYAEDAVYDAGLHVYTAMDPVHQLAAEHSLREGLHDASKRRGWLGPLQRIPLVEHESFIKKHAFTPEILANAGWVKALVTKVTAGGAEVRLGAYKGFISVDTMGWCRVPNANVSPESAGKIRDASKVLSVGDLVWVSAVGASGTRNPVSAPARPDPKKPVLAYDPKTVTPQTAIALCLEQEPDLQGAVASIDVEKKALVAIAGGYAFSSDSQFNRATQAKRQPGSSFKPIVYSTALDHGFTAGSILLDSPFILPAGPGGKIWKPGNFDGKFLGPILLRTALAKSRNVCTVRVAQSVGMEAIVERAHALGITGDIPPVLAVSLGSYEVTPLGMAEAYTAFANKGEYFKPRIITSIANCWKEEIVRFDADTKQAISPQNAYIMATLLKEVVRAGTAAKANVLGRPIAGKTGTSNDERDAWFIGFSPYIVTSVYVGYDNNTPMGKMETGGRAALPIFIGYRKAIDPLYPPEDFQMPSGISMLRIDANSGYTAGSGSSESYSLPFYTGTEPHYASSSEIKTDEDVQSAEDLLRQ